MLIGGFLFSIQSRPLESSSPPRKHGNTQPPTAAQTTEGAGATAAETRTATETKTTGTAATATTTETETAKPGAIQNRTQATTCYSSSAKAGAHSTAWGLYHDLEPEAVCPEGGQGTTGVLATRERAETAQSEA